MIDVESLKSRLERVIENTKPNRSAIWDAWNTTMTVLLGVTTILGGAAATVFSLGVGAPVGAAAAAAGVTLIWSVSLEAAQEYNKTEWINGGKINYINFIINGAASFYLGLLGGNISQHQESLELIERTVTSYENYFKDKFDGGRFLSAEQLKEVITKDNILSSFFVSNYAITEKIHFEDEFSEESNEVLKSALIESIGDNQKFERIVGTNFTLRYMIQNGFSPVLVSRMVGTKVGLEMNNLESVTIQINDNPNNLFTLAASTEDNELYWKINQPKLRNEKKIRQLAFGSIWESTKAKLDSKSVEFPWGVYDQDTPEGAEALMDLEKDKSLEDMDIRTYKFQFYDEIPDDIHRPLADILVDFFTNRATKSPQDMVKYTVENKYVDFVLKLMEDYNENTRLDNTLFSTFDTVFDDEFIRLVYSLIVIDKELARRISLFNLLADRSQSIDADNGDRISEEDVKKLEAEAVKAFAASDVERGEDTLTEEQIENRQRFYKQCALMLNLKRLDEKFEDVIIDRQNVYEKFDGPIKNKPFGGRFWRAKSKNTEQLITNLVSSKDAGYMFEIPAHIMTQLTPKFRLYKVFNDQKGKLKDAEFIFPAYTDIDRKKNFIKNQDTTQEPTIPTFLGSQFDKGDGVGLKSFSLDFNGTNPAEARNDVKGQMSLFFQSFADFTRKRVDPNNNEYRFVDLIIQPKPDQSNRTQGVKITSLRQYEPSFYRIRVDMGYNIPKEGDIQGINEKKNKNGESDLTRLQNALRAMNKSFYLCMIDHDFNINNDGTVQMNFTYRAYLETALKSLRFDALTTPELARKRIENETKLHDVATSKKCTKNELIELQLALAGVEEEMILNSLNSIMNRLYSRDKVFTVEVDNEDRKFFLKNGFYRSCDLIGTAELSSTPANSSDGDLGIVLNSTFLSSDPDVNFERDVNDTNIQFFFFGDLLHTILDALYDPDDDTRSKVAVGLENTKIILGHFDFDPYQTNASDGTYNISNIPISVDFFGEWFKQNILNQKSTRRSFPILNFIRNLSNHLVNNALLESCVNRNIDKAIRFQTGQISAISSDGKDPIGKYINANKSYKILDTDQMRRFKKLPLNGDVEGNPNVDNFYHYIVLSCNGSALTYAGAGNYKEDIEAGRFHVEIGSNRGLVKNVKFAKTDMQYLREARFFRNGIDGLLQLSSVYTATVEMFGNTLFYPGMDLWINPYGFGGTTLGSPHQGDRGTKKISNRSLANILGIGGYHTITGVSINLTPQGFTTSIKSQHYYSGDGDVPDSKGLKSSTDKKENELIEQGVNEDAQTRDAEYCKAEILEVINFNARDDSSGNPAPSISAPTTTPSTGVSTASSSTISTGYSAPSTAATTTSTSTSAKYEDLVAKYGANNIGFYEGKSGMFRSERNSFGILNELYFIPNGQNGPDESSKIRITK
jgi:hypothetical protein